HVLICMVYEVAVNVRAGQDVVCGHQLVDHGVEAGSPVMVAVTRIVNVRYHRHAPIGQQQVDHLLHIVLVSCRVGGVAGGIIGSVVESPIIIIRVVDQVLRQ